jgi:hypothetical protein
MSRIAKWGSVVAVGTLVMGVLFATQNAAQARPQYCKLFIGHYTEVKAAAEAKCAICHVGDDKKNRNNYGVALSKLVPEKNCKDEAAIKEALKKAEGEKSAVEGKTFGDLLKAGELPGAK